MFTPNLVDFHQKFSQIIKNLMSQHQIQPKKNEIWSIISFYYQCKNMLKNTRQ